MNKMTEKWWESLDVYWKRFFRIYLQPDLEWNKIARDSFIPSEQDIISLMVLKSVDISNCSIDHLKPLTFLEDLKSISLLNLSSLKQLDEVSDLNLTHFSMSNCKVQSVTPLAFQKELIALSLSNNSLSELNVLGELSGLITLNLCEPELMNISEIGSLSNLKVLKISKLFMRDVGPLAFLKELRQLQLSEVAVKSLDRIAELTQLTDLEINQLSINSLNGIQNMDQLQRLRISNCEIGDYSPIASLSTLRKLDICKTTIRSIRLLVKLTHLQELIIPDHIGEEEIAFFKDANPFCRVYRTGGNLFQFMKQGTYQVVKEFRGLLQGTHIRFISVAHNVYDSELIYLFQCVDNQTMVEVMLHPQEMINWSEIVTLISSQLNSN